MRLEPGITCVVGPNGSGKSNVVDALAWVMGEQGAKQLRGGNMADVIFAGTSTRPALGRAHVELTIDNSDGHLPIDFSEVTISRTLFRGGGSEYSINGAPARLLDIQDLLSDTGMGRQMHVIVGQGQLDTILTSTPEERRGFIEEAAGVLKHRKRKERALKKLSDMDANLVRVLDLTQEIQRQLGPLARQAKAARRAHRVQAALRDAKSRLLAEDIVNARQRLESHAQDEEAMQQRLSQLAERSHDLKRQITDLETQLEVSHPQLDAVTSVWQRALTVHERLSATQLAAHQRIDMHALTTTPPTSDNPEEIDAKAEEATQEDAAVLEELESLKSALQRAERAKEAAEDADESASRELATANRALADYREKIARLTGDVSSTHSRLEAALAEAERARNVYESALERQKKAQLDAGSGLVEEKPEDSSSAAQAHSRAVEIRDAARAQVDALIAREREARTQRAHWESRRDALEQSLIPEDATADLVEKSGVLGLLPKFVRAQADYEDAVAAALAPYTDAALTDGVGTSIDRLRDTHADLAGRIRLLHGSQDDRDEAAAGSSTLVELPAGVRWAIDCVSVKDPARTVVAQLLCGTVICDELEQVKELLKQEGISRVVTKTGDVLTAYSATGQGSTARSTLALHAQFNEAVDGAQTAYAEEQQAAQDLLEANDALDAAIRAANDALKALRAEDAERAKVAQERARMQSMAQAAVAEAQRAHTVLQRANEQVQWAKEQVAEAEERKTAAAQLQPPPDISQAQKVAEDASAAARNAREAETAARLALRAAEEKSRQVQAKARSLRQAAARIREEQAAYQRREAARLRDLQQAQLVVVEVEKALAVSRGIMDRAQTAREEAQSRRAEIGETLTRLRKERDDVTADEAQLRDTSHRDEVARAEMRLRLEQVEARALEELTVEADELVERFGPHQLAPQDLLGFVEDSDEHAQDSELVPYSRQHQQAALQRAQKELTRLGRINPLALEEHAALAKRHEFLVSQVQDLKKSKADLLQIIEDVDRLVNEAFTQAWNDTAEQFQKVFSTLFPGGTGRLILTDPDNMLTTGIEIEAKPAGKKVKRLSLLSGGERSLAALAFLVAIFQARPSPFYVMDEVEAALDDVNLSRLLEVFKQLQMTSQLIVITHQKRTMEIADALYGVTMREGVTAVVSQRLGSQ